MDGKPDPIEELDVEIKGWEEQANLLLNPKLKSSISAEAIESAVSELRSKIELIRPSLEGILRVPSMDEHDRVYQLQKRIKSLCEKLGIEIIAGEVSEIEGLEMTGEFVENQEEVPLQLPEQVVDLSEKEVKSVHVISENPVTASKYFFEAPERILNAPDICITLNSPMGYIKGKVDGSVLFAYEINLHITLRTYEALDYICEKLGKYRSAIEKLLSHKQQLAAVHINYRAPKRGVWHGIFMKEIDEEGKPKIPPDLNNNPNIYPLLTPADQVVIAIIGDKAIININCPLEIGSPTKEK